MTFPLGSLGSGASAAGAAYTRQPARAHAAVPVAAWRAQTSVLFGAVLWLLALLALATYNPADAAFSTSGTSLVTHNRAGVGGAWLSDFAYFLFGYSAWWIMAATLRAWLGALARLLRSDAAGPTQPLSRWPFWVGLGLLLAASCALEWTRLYAWESRLPDHAGGVLGYTLGPLSMKWLGFAGSGVLWIATLLAGLSLAFRFSWLAVAEAIGARLEGVREHRAERIERAEDQRLGAAALREREHVVEAEIQLQDEHLPIVIEPEVVEVPKSARVAKERQKPLFVELADTRLPQVDLLDAAPGRTESVTADTLEMTSRLIEKKLKDFGVEVRVVAASPGPVLVLE